MSPAKQKEEADEADKEDGMTELQKSRHRAAQWAKDEKARKAQDAKKKADVAAAKGETAAATPKKRASSRKK